jgi:hypothetical protein
MYWLRRFDGLIPADALCVQRPLPSHSGRRIAAARRTSDDPHLIKKNALRHNLKGLLQVVINLGVANLRKCGLVDCVIEQSA